MDQSIGRFLLRIEKYCYFSPVVATGIICPPASPNVQSGELTIRRLTSIAREHARIGTTSSSEWCDNTGQWPPKSGDRACKSRPPRRGAASACDDARYGATGGGSATSTCTNNAGATLTPPVSPRIILWAEGRRRFMDRVFVSRS